MIPFIVIALMLIIAIILITLMLTVNVSFIQQSLQDSLYQISDGSGNYISFHNNFSLASSSKTGSSLQILENKYILFNNEYVSYKEVAGRYLVVLINTKTAWKITDHFISTTIQNKTYYLGFETTGTGDFEIVSVTLSTSPKTLKIVKI